MKKINTAPLSGMQELLPTNQAVFDRLKNQISQAFHQHGFMHIETPVIDRTEILFAKAGGDTEKQIYKVIKTTESAEESDQALRFDHTVPLARYVVEHANDLAFPFHATQIDRNYRGERAQKGRFREFYQCDVDIVGRGQLPIAYDAQAIAATYAALKTFNLPGITVRINNRKLLSGFLNILGLTDKAAEISHIIDHAEKVPPETTADSLYALNISKENVVKITTFINAKGTPDQIETNLKTILDNLEPLAEGLAELRTVHDLLAQTIPADNLIIDLMIVRGLDYYTGTVFETILPDYRAIGSIASGGRYDNLASNFTDQNYPGVGGSIGLTRLFYILNQHNLLTTSANEPIDIAIIPLGPDQFNYALKVAQQLRTQDQSVNLILTDKKLSDKLAHAAKIAQNVIVIGEEEQKNRQLNLKNLTTGKISPLEIN